VHACHAGDTTAPWQPRTSPETDLFAAWVGMVSRAAGIRPLLVVMVMVLSRMSSGQWVRYIYI
jgi:hypothetical protein